MNESSRRTSGCVQMRASWPQILSSVEREGHLVGLSPARLLIVGLSSGLPATMCGAAGIAVTETDAERDHLRFDDPAKNDEPDAEVSLTWIAGMRLVAPTSRFQTRPVVDPLPIGAL